MSGDEDPPVAKDSASLDAKFGPGKKMLGYLWVLASVALQLSATILTKFAAIDNSAHQNGLVRSVFNPYYCAGLLCLGVQLVTWRRALFLLPLSVAYPCMAIIFPLHLMVAINVFGEPWALKDALGVLAIAGGVLVITREG